MDKNRILELAREKLFRLILFPITRSADRKYISAIFSQISLKHSKIKAINSMKIT
jgi:hypothetical protein